MAIIGKNILENLTTGMYSDSRVIFREYIQNACDQIDLAVKEHLICQEDANIDIFIDSSKKYISIRDNATGVSVNEFMNALSDIANSGKKLGEQKGFRGIGRLCGLAYCETLKFKTSFRGEPTASIMTCNASKMRKMLLEDKKYSLDEVWDTIISFSREQEETNEHFFEVELINVNDESAELLDNKQIVEYLSFVAPLPYQNTFIFREKVYEHAKNINYHIDEYKIIVNGQQIFKKYTTSLKDAVNSSLKEYDQIKDVEFKDFYDANHNLIAWMWYGSSCFVKQIPECNQMRGLRLRSGNIQIGDDDVFKDLFKEKEQRGNYYFVGEVFAVDKLLIPNSQRDYFNENENRIRFEDLLRDFFSTDLHKLYYFASKVKNAYKHQQTYIDKQEKFDMKDKNNGFVDKKSRDKEIFELEKAQQDAKKAINFLKNLTSNNMTIPMHKVQKNIEMMVKKDRIENEIQPVINKIIPENFNKKDNYISSKMSRLTRNERKIVSKILSIISELASKDTADAIIERINKEFR